MRRALVVLVAGLHGPQGLAFEDDERFAQDEGLVDGHGPRLADHHIRQAEAGDGRACEVAQDGLAVGRAQAEDVAPDRSVVPAQEDQVRLAYNRYQASMALATNAYVALVTSQDTNGWARASQAITASSGTLLNLIVQFSSTTKTNR